MTYATPSQFVQSFGLSEIADLLSDEQGSITSELLAEAVAGAFAEGRTDAEKNIALEGLKRLENALHETCKLMDSYLRNSVVLPLTNEQIANAPVTACCLDLSRCYLQDDDDNMTEGTEKRCKRWMDWLRDVSTGKVKIVHEQQSGSHGVMHGRLPSRYNWRCFGR